jgi:hypothetical protein
MIKMLIFIYFILLFCCLFDSLFCSRIVISFISKDGQCRINGSGFTLIGCLDKYSRNTYIYDRYLFALSASSTHTACCVVNFFYDFDCKFFLKTFLQPSLCYDCVFHSLSLSLTQMTIKLPLALLALFNRVRIYGEAAQKDSI